MRLAMVQPPTVAKLRIRREAGRGAPEADAGRPGDGGAAPSSRWSAMDQPSPSSGAAASMAARRRVSMVFILPAEVIFNPNRSLT